MFGGFMIAVLFVAAISPSEAWSPASGTKNGRGFQSQVTQTSLPIPGDTRQQRTAGGWGQKWWSGLGFNFLFSATSTTMPPPPLPPSITTPFNALPGMCARVTCGPVSVLSWVMWEMWGMVDCRGPTWFCNLKKFTTNCNEIHLAAIWVSDSTHNYYWAQRKHKRATIWNSPPTCRCICRYLILICYC